MLKVKDINVYYGAIHALKDVSFEVQRRGDRRPDRRQRRRQNPPPCRPSPACCAPRPAASTFWRQDIYPGSPATRSSRMGLAHVPEGRRIFLQMTVQENLEMGAYTRPARRAHPRGLEEVYEPLPPAEGAPQPGGGHPLRRRAADAGHGPGADEPTPKLLMLDEPSMGLAPILVEQIFDIIQELHQSRHHHPAGGAERQNGPVRRRPGLCAGIRQRSSLSGTGA